MGANQSLYPNLNSKLPQEAAFIDLCDKIPQNISACLSYDVNTESYKWNGWSEQNGWIVSKKGIPPTNSINPSKSLLMSAGAYTGGVIKHLLDGYSAGIVVIVCVDENGYLNLKLNSVVVETDRDIYKEERAGASKKPGLFTSEMPWWVKMFGGNIFKFLAQRRAIERDTAHQPLYFPPKQAVLFCGTTKYHSFKCDKNRLEPNGWIPQLNAQEYACMHPHYDPTTKRMLTYTFTHSVLSRKTQVTFHEYGENGEHLSTKHTINDRAALHMFGFTENYYVLFANPLKLEKCGEARILFGKPILRALDDSFISNLILHFVPRPKSDQNNVNNVNNTNNTLSAFSVDTKRHGFVYHSINCFETDDNKIVVDAFVSQLNASRESAQFEFDRDVYDNNGDPYRFIISMGEDQDPCKSYLVASLVDSTIDFHCINGDRNGLKHRYSWIVGHERLRDQEGNVSKVVSTLYKIDYNLIVDSRKTMTHSIKSSQLNETASCYFRTPMFVKRNTHTTTTENEDDGYLFMWSYELENDETVAKMLVISAVDLQVLYAFELPCTLPYSVHSLNYTF